MNVHFYTAPMTQLTPITKGEHTAARILDAGADQFALKGYAATSMRDIASGAGIRPAAIYNHFPSKQDLLFHIMEGHMEALLGGWRATPDQPDPVAALQAFTNFHIDYHEDKSREVFLSYMELRSLEPQNLAQISKMRATYEEALVEILQRGNDQGAFDLPDIPVTAKALIGMLAGISDWYRPGGRLDLAQLKSMYWQLTRQMVGVKGE